MAILMRLRAALRPPQADDGYMQEASDPAAIRDGLSYEMPLVLPRATAEALRERGLLQKYLQEAQTFRFQFDTPFRSAADAGILPTTEDPLTEWDWSTREQVLSNCHAAYHRNPIAKRAANYVASFVVGEGFTLACKNKQVERVLRDFIDDPDNDVRTCERQAVIDLLVDGELVTRFFEEAGQTVMVPMRPWELRWIETERGFFRRYRVFHFQRQTREGDSPGSGTQTEIEDVPADEILFVAINRHQYELRGRPDLYVILPWLRAYKEWLENRARQNHWRNALLWWVKVQTTSKDTLAKVAARWRKPPTPGSVAVTSAAEEVQAVNNPVGGGEAAEDGRQIKLMSAVGMGLPEYFLGDGENANLASATRQELPAMTTFGDYQRIMRQYWKTVMRRVVLAAVEAGRLPAMVQVEDPDGDPIEGGEMVEAVESFDLTYAPLWQDDAKTLAEAMEIMARNGWVDDETAIGELGYDYNIVQKRLQQQRERQRDDMALGRIPTPPGFPVPGYEDPDDEDETPEEEQADDDAPITTAR